ncbi:multicopper oxidase domain-containing protein [Terrabacter sp. BE26]|uniref:multicopper oxidase domain-containing protein n=1 Tax=Terrabacter sp. BE26 TaxID=2898152 RepID=UPI0035BE7E15
MTSRPSLRLRLGVSAVAAALSTVPLAGTALAATTAYAVTPASVPTSGAAVAPSTASTAATAAPAAPVGKLTPNTPGCTLTPASGTDPEVVACDLWAKPGTNEFLSQSIPIWGYSTTEAGAATAPGPVIVARQGDVVKLTLHNGLGEATSLALPGQAAGDFSAGLPSKVTGTAPDTDGIAPGATATYSFTASRAGTFLYEAGHTAGGARQVAMGLAGALVVLSTDGTAYGQSYDDEAVLVLSEIDPALNADPAKFTDLREFKPKFRLINGKPFPSTDPVATDQGHKVLLRYVNAGTELHPMSLLGGEQQLLSNDGHALGTPEPSVVAAVDPGVTMDSLVTMPSGPEAKVALFESAAQLDNGGQTTADPLSVAFGGMLTFLDTNAPPPSTDSVGPASTAVAVTPNPADGTGAVTVTATVTDATSGGSAIDQAELVVDDDVATIAAGSSPIQMTGTFGSSSAVVTGTIPASATAAQCSSSNPPVDLHCLSSSKHTIYVRGHDTALNWGVVGSVTLNLAKTGPQTVAGTVSPNPANGTGTVTLSATGDDTAAGGTITAGEYFVGTPGVDGTGFAMTPNRSAAKVALTATIPAASVKAAGEGTTHLFVHSLNSQGIWGPPLDVPLVVDTTAPQVNAASVGPNPTNGVVSSKAYPGYLVVSTEVEDRDAGGATQSNITGAEAFLDPGSAPVFGKGLTLIAVDGAFDSPKEQAYGLIPLTQIKALPAGEHTVFVHAKDAAGNWGDLTAGNALVRLLVDKTAPVLGTMTGSPTPTNGATTLTLSAGVTETTLPSYVGARLQGAEFWTGTTDPGAGKATPVQITDNGTGVTATIPLAGIQSGLVQFNLRVQDAAGNWSNAASVTVKVVRPNPIFSDTFDTNSLSRWSARTGAVTTSPAAGMPLGTGNYGMVATGSRNPAFVTDNTPSAETTYHAQFAFNANTLSSGTSPTAWVTVFEGRTTAGQAVAVQFHRIGGTGSGQVRLVMARNAGGNLTGPAVTLPTGNRTVRVDWQQGATATGATPGRAVLSVDGTARTTLLGANNNTALRIEAARLGLSAGTTSTTAGTAWFDSFTSTRNSLP